MPIQSFPTDNERVFPLQSIDQYTHINVNPQNNSNNSRSQIVASIFSKKQKQMTRKGRPPINCSGERDSAFCRRRISTQLDWGRPLILRPEGRLVVADVVS
ncbi:hypothetical protein NPIL_360781 [Nephila pilipes]|uniref:Uncharacterized protein n=1 Tax=Nephila pilipes TaxID=299642 RepID=A0A8X6Q7X4_NEPPI|nr:hypothetical protein NPIL_360781 [Nephila pilipes]